MVMGTRQKWVAILVMLVGLLFLGADLGHADRDRHRDKGHGEQGHGYRSHGHRDHGHRGHRHRGHGHRGGHRSGGERVFISPGLVVPFGSDWEPYPDPPVVMAPSPRVYLEPSPPHYWYYCDASQAYYPYVPQCPGGWRAVSPAPE
jgi:hypothetical protein